MAYRLHQRANLACAKCGNFFWEYFKIIIIIGQGSQETKEGIVCHVCEPKKYGELLLQAIKIEPIGFLEKTQKGKKYIDHTIVVESGKPSPITEDRQVSYDSDLNQVLDEKHRKLD